MTNYDDSQIVDYLFDEMSEEDERAFERTMSEDAVLSREVHELDDTLDTYRSVEDAEPSAHLDALILATARQVADETQAEAEEKSIFGRFRKYLFNPVAGVVAAASVALIAGIIAVPMMSPSPESVAREALPMGASRAPTVPASPATNEVAPPPPPPPRSPPAVANLEAPPVDEPAPAKPKRSVRPKRRRTRARKVPPPSRAPTPRQMIVEETKPLARAETLKKKKSVARKPVAPIEDTLGDDRSMADDFGSNKPDDELDALVDEAPEAARAEGPAPAAAPEPEPAPEPEAPTTTLDSAPAARRAAGRSTRRPPSAGEAKDAIRSDTAESRNVVAARIARDMITAAEQELKRGQVDSARRILSRALARTRGTPSVGDVLLRMAYLERAQGRYAVCVDLAERARVVRGFTRQKEAEALIRQVAPLIERPNAPATAAPPQ